MTTAAQEPPPTEQQEAPKAVREYAEWCGEHIRERDKELSKALTMGDLSKVLKDSHADLKDREPPPEIQEYHQQQLQALAAMYAMAEEEPDQPAGLLFIVEMLTGPWALSETGSLGSLPPEVKQELLDSGCLDEEVAKQIGALHIAGHTKDPFTDEVNVFFMLDTSADSPDPGAVFLAQDCKGNPTQLYIDIYVSGYGDAETLMVRVSDYNPTEESWSWEEDLPVPEEAVGTLLSPPTGRNSHYVAELMRGEPLAVRAPDITGTGEQTFTFSPIGPLALSEENIAESCSG